MTLTPSDLKILHRLQKAREAQLIFDSLTPKERRLFEEAKWLEDRVPTFLFCGVLLTGFLLVLVFKYPWLFGVWS